MRIALIPARGGSQRIPRKNLREMNGKPIIAWPITAAIKSGIFDRVIVSTEDQEIAQVSQLFGAEVPFVRPSPLATHTTSTRSVVEHAIRTLETSAAELGEVCCIYATAIFTDTNDIKQSWRRFLPAYDSGFCLSVTRFSHPIERALVLTSPDRMGAISPSSMNVRSQDLGTYFHDAGQFYWASSRTWLSSQPIFQTFVPYEMPSWRVQDIDTEEDWKRAQIIHRALLTSQLKP